ncbi:MAG: hypothetical protein ABSC72_08385 [Methylovirgula sp.]
MAKSDKAPDPRRWPSSYYVAFSLITLGTIALIPKIVFLYPWLFVGDVPIPAIAIFVGLVLLDVSTVCTGIAVARQWDSYKVFGLICALGITIDATSMWILVRFIAHPNRPQFLGDLAFRGNLYDIAFAYVFVTQALSLAAHAPSEIYFLRCARKSYRDKPRAN